MRKYIFVVSAIFVLSGCAISEGLNSVSKTIGNTVNTISSVADAPEQDISELIPVVSDATQKQQITEAKPVIQKVLSELACAKDKRSSVFQRYAISNWVFTSSITGTPIYSMDNHVSGCTTITRINNYKYVAKNAFSFDVTFESPQSGEVQRRNFEVQKQPEGDWLFSKYDRKL